MEHRYNERIPVDLKALIVIDGLPMISGRITNLSVDGLFIELGVCPIQTHSWVTLELEPNGREVNQATTLMAFVIHQSEHGLGLMFTKPIPELFRHIKQCQDEAKYIAVAS